MKVRGLRSKLSGTRRLSEAAIGALQRGDIDDLIRINREEFGGFRMMADGDDDDDDDDDDSDDDADDADDDDAGKQKKDKDDDSDKDDSDDNDDDSEKETLRKRMKAADKRAAEAEKRLKKIEDAKKDDLTRAEDRVKELEEEGVALQSEITTLRLQNAFLTANDHDWHDPEDALDVAERKGYLEDVIDDDGVVSSKALRKALDRLAKEKKYLVKSKSDRDDDDDDSGPSGEPGGGRSDNSKDTRAKKQKQRQRFPVLNR